MALVDFNTLFSDPLKNLKAARYALQKTETGRAGVVRVDLDENNKLVYRLITDGRKYASYEEAFSQASSEMVTKFNIVKPIERITKIFKGQSISGVVKASGTQVYNPKVEQVGEFLGVLNKNLGVLNNHRDQLEKLGMTTEDIDNLISGNRKISLQLSQLKDQTDVRNYAKDFISRQLKKIGAENYFPFIDKDGANVLRFQSYLSAGSDEAVKTFTNAQIQYILRASGMSMLDDAKLKGLFGPGEKSIEDFLEKLPKRFKALFSERDVTLTADDIISGLKIKNVTDVNKAVDESVLIVEEGLDFLRQAMKVDPRSSAIGAAFSHIGESGSLDVLNASLRRQDVATPNEFLERLFGEKGVLRAELSTAQTTDELIEMVEAGTTRGLLKETELDIFKKMMKHAELEFDGDAVINKRVFNSRLTRLKAEIAEFKDALRLDPANENLQNSMQNLQKQLALLQDSDLYQITGRGFLGQGQPKFAAQIRSFDGVLSGFSMIIGRSGMKKELGFGKGGLREIILSGFGQAKGIVYSDPNLVATHPELFGTPQALDAIKKNSTKVLIEMNQAMSQDMLTPRVLTSLRKQLEGDFTGLPEPVRLAKENNRRFAQEILRLHEMGVGPKNSPTMMNYLAKIFQSEMFTYEESDTYGKIFNPALPDTYRIALSTESIHGAARDDFRSALQGLGGADVGYARSQIASLGRSADTASITTDLMRFRLHDSRLLFGAGGVPDFYSSLGGFDLDDKGILRLMTYEDTRGRSRLMFSLTRQPTSFQESIYGRMKFDAESLKQLFRRQRRIYDRT